MNDKPGKKREDNEPDDDLAVPDDDLTIETDDDVEPADRRRDPLRRP